MNNATFFADIKKSLFRGKFSQKQVDGLNVLLDASSDLPLRWRAYILATAYHETARTMQPIYEKGGHKYFRKYDWILGNEGKADGYKYRGRGYVQLTGKNNYHTAGQNLGIDLVLKPDLALKPAIAAKITVLGMESGWFTGKKLDDYTRYDSMRRIVNGKDRASLIASYAEAFEHALGPAVAPKEVQKITTGKPAVKSTTNIAAVTAGLSMAAGASGDARQVIANLGVDPKWLLLAIGIATAVWIIRERVLKARNEGV